MQKQLSSFVFLSLLCLFLGVSDVRAQYAGLWYWTWSGTVNTGITNLTIAFSGQLDPDLAMSDSAGVLSRSTGVIYLSLGGGNAVGHWTSAAITKIKSYCSTKKYTGYTGLAFDIEEGDSGLSAAFESAFLTCKQNGYKVLVTISHAAPYGIGDSTALMAGFFASTNIDLMSPQLYTTGSESTNDFTEGEVKWTNYTPFSGKFVPSIVTSSLYQNAKDYFAAKGITCVGYIQWSQTVTSGGSTSGSSSSTVRCGTDWTNANSICGQVCATDADCTAVANTHCYANVNPCPTSSTSGAGSTSAGSTSAGSTSAGSTSGSSTGSTTSAVSTIRCGVDWTSANSNCGKVCVSDADCTSIGQLCFRDVNPCPISTTGTSAPAGTSTGTTGVAGTTGTTGAPVTTGTTGAAVTTGTTGAPVTTGTTGAGTTGKSTTAPGGTSSGTTGIVGTTGTSGAAGTTRTVTTGTTGAPVTTGTTGAAVTTGTTGAPVTTGTTGAPVTTGTTGAAVTTGTTGVAVTTGTTGAAVTTGTTGAAVTTGTTGVAGTTGKSTAAGTTSAVVTTSSTGSSGISVSTSTGPSSTSSTGSPGTTGAPVTTIVATSGAAGTSSSAVASTGISVTTSSTGPSSTSTVTVTTAVGTSASVSTSTGTTGPDGTTGTTGPDGTTESDGTTGTTGSDGTTGSSGVVATGTTGSGTFTSSNSSDFQQANSAALPVGSIIGIVIGVIVAVAVVVVVIIIIVKKGVSETI